MYLCKGTRPYLIDNGIFQENTCSAGMSSFSGTLIRQRAKGLVKYACYNVFSLYHGCLPYILLITGAMKIIGSTEDFVIYIFG